MIEMILVEDLTPVMDGVPVLCEEPTSPPEQMIIIQKTRGSRTNQVDSATVAIQSYGHSLYEAGMLNDRVKREMLDGSVILDDRISSVRLNSDYNWTDTATRRYRYQAVFDIVYYEEE